MHACLKLGILLVAFASTSVRAATPEPGVALSFDDDFVDQWFDNAALLESYGAKVTFYVTRYEELSAERKAKLHELQKRGHEIGYHTVTHVDAEVFLQTHSVDEYLAQEIDPGLKRMNDDGFFPQTFAYPWNGHTPETDAALKARFRFVRGSARLKHGDTYLYQPDGRDHGQTMMPGASLDAANFDADLLEKALTKVQQDGNSVAILYAHQITAVDSPRSHITPASLEQVLKSARDKGLKFYTMKELAPARPAGHEVIYRALEKGTVAKADLMLQNIFPVDRFADTPMPGGPHWNEDPFQEKYWRFLFYSTRSWSHLPFAFDATGDRRYIDRLAYLTKSFLNNGGLASEGVKDPHTSAFLAMMLVKYQARLQRGGALTPELDHDFSSGLRNRGLFLADPVNFEASYNHALTEAAALFMVATLHPYLAEAPAWRRLAIERLTHVTRDLIDADGVQVEQSPFYHFYVLKFLAEIDRWAGANGLTMDGLDLHGLVASMLPFATRIALPNGELPHFSSSTDYNVQKDGILDALTGVDPAFDYIRSKGAVGTAPSPSSKVFPTAGFAVLRTPFAAGPAYAKATQVVLDVGPYRTTHSQFDALTMVFYADRPLLVDSGLYSYEKSISRDYYVSTAAHNTVVVDGLNQALGAAHPETFASGATTGWSYSSGSHDLYAGVHHKRGVLLLGRDLSLVIDDLADASGASHRYAQMWHLAPDLNLSAAPDLSAVGADASGATALRIVPLVVEGLGIRQFRGEIAPKQGWVSQLYEQEVPAAALAYDQAGAHARYATLLAGGELARSGNVAARVTSLAADSLEVEVKAADDVWTIVIQGFTNAQESVGVTRNAPP